MLRIIPHVAAWLLILLATSPAGSATPASLDAEIISREQAMNAAFAANDADRYFAFFAADMTGIFYDRDVTLSTYRQSWDEEFAAGRRVRTVKLGNIGVRLLPGNTAAIAYFTLDLTIDHPDGDISTEHAFQTDVWIKRKGDWQLLHAHFAVATPPAH